MIGGRSNSASATTILENQIFRYDGMAKADRRWIDPADVQRALTAPLRKERQADGRVRYWAYVPRLQSYIRVVTLADGETVHNVFKDGGFIE